MFETNDPNGNIKEEAENDGKTFIYLINSKFHFSNFTL